MTDSLRLRTETQSDHAIVSVIHDAAFGGPKEAELVRLIRGGDAFVPELSIVAEKDETIVGHVLFSRISLLEEGTDLNALSLAPVAVAPEHQRRHIGSSLIREGIFRANALGFHSILVLGDPKYYCRFGFKHALTANISSVYACKAFMGLELKPGALSGIRNASAAYPNAFKVVD